MSFDASKIELGEGVLTLKASGDSSPVDVGGTSGANFSYVPNFKKIEIGQSMSPVKTIMIGEEGKFKVKLAESSMRNLAIALGLAPSSVSSSVSSDTITFGGKVSATTYEAVYTVPQIDTPAKNYVFTFYKAQAVSGLALPFEKSNERFFEVEFELMADASKANALGTIVRER